MGYFLFVEWASCDEFVVEAANAECALKYATSMVGPKRYDYEFDIGYEYELTEEEMLESALDLY